ncbi:spore coat protein U domain-containing protein [Ramlibacter humi]|uniref:Spore coat protein U/FanG domain-containing protein n=1 Tax=Ramlibacter humi TaxID=2530451 RepID=A0A4Z0BWJ6_9BURK|nr:spore coat protein U domain-containing protein [Ramlibacter humi]TFZ03593.1 hypothetical protein EZ216_07950 [Ramlibacter humi]
MNGLFRCLALIAGVAIALGGGAARAASSTSTFQVAITLTPKCFVNIDTTGPASQATTNIALAYSAFQATPAQGSTSFNVRCSNTLPYSIAIAPDTSSAAGITYFLKVVAGTTASYSGTTGGGTLPGLTGSGADQPYTVGAQAAGGQAGTCATTAGCAASSANHTVTVTY